MPEKQATFFNAMNILQRQHFVLQTKASSLTGGIL